MVERSTVMLIVVFLVLALSFKDLMTIRISAQSDENDGTKQVKSAAAAKSNLDDENESSKEFSSNNNIYESTNFDDEDSESSGGVDQQKKIPQLKLKKNMQTLKFLFCYSCGYRNMYEQYSQIIRSRYPDINIIGENYQASVGRVYFAQFLSTFKLVLIGLILFGQNPFPYLNMNTPNIFTWAVENKLYASLMIFFISNAIETQLISTGAFEIYLNDMQIWSKLESDRMPHDKELIQILDVNFNFDSAKNDAFGTGAGNFNPNDIKL